MPEYFITAELVLDTALHIGVGKGGAPTDDPVRRAGNGRLLIPGTAIAGSLRAAATRLAPRLGLAACRALLNKQQQDADKEKPCGCPVCQLFGDVNPVEKPAGFQGDWQDAAASHLWIQDAFAAADTATYVRDGVGIDRVSGHASKNVKFDYEVAPRKTAFHLNMRLAYNLDAETQQVDGDMAQTMEMLLTAVLLEWQAGRGQLGGNISRGLGRFRLRDLAWKAPQLGAAADLTAYLKASNRSDVSQPVDGWPDTLLAAARSRRAPQAAVGGTFLTVAFDLQFKDLFLQHDPLTAMLSGFDHAPLIEKITDDGLGNPVLAGSAIRGVLRSQAGKIIRTLYTNHCLPDDLTDVAAVKNAASAFLRDCPSCNVLEDENDQAIASCVSRLDNAQEQNRYYEWQEDDFCLTCRLFGNQERGSRLWIQDAVWQKPDGVSWMAQDFLAIDRFTGGGLEGVKFDAAPLTMARFQTAVTLRNPAKWELGLLALLLRDLAEGRITIGFGAAKGYGRVQASGFSWQVGYLTPDDVAQFSALTTAVDSGIYDLSTNDADSWLPADWLETADGWVSEFNNTVKAFQKPGHVSELKIDTFFDKETGLSEVGKLYGRSRVEVD